MPSNLALHLTAILLHSIATGELYREVFRINMKTQEHEINYVRWQNRAFHFYLASRLLYLNQHVAPAAFCAQQALELMLKATLIYHDKSFQPEIIGHAFNKMLKVLKNKVRNSHDVNIPEYFYYDKRYQTVSRYPSEGKKLLLPENMLDDLDECFYDLLVLVPFQFNTVLVNTLNPRDEKARRKLNTLRRYNRQMRNIRRFLRNWVKT